jgi:hypothetical protein
MARRNEQKRNYSAGGFWRRFGMVIVATAPVAVDAGKTAISSATRVPLPAMARAFRDAELRGNRPVAGGSGGDRS